MLKNLSAKHHPGGRKPFSKSATHDPFAAQLIAQRLARGMSQFEVAIIAGVHRNTVSRVERGYRSNMSDMEAIANAIGLEFVLQAKKSPG